MNKIKPKRSYTANSVPLTTDLETNELAINWADGKAYTKNASGQIVSVTLGGSGGSSSSEDTALRAFFLPTAPTNVVATAGNAQASVTWTASTTIVQIPVTDYVVQFSSNGGTSWTTFSDGTATSTSAVVTGLQNSTSYVFRVAGTNGVGTGAYSAASSAVTPIAGDPLFGNVSLLLHMDGSGSTFTDSSAHGRAVTANGDVTQSTAQSKFGGKAAYLDGSGDYLSCADSASLNMGSGDFVAECWVNISAKANNAGIIGKGPVGNLTNTTWSVEFNGAANTLSVFIYNANISSYIINGSQNVVGNGWHHVALARSGNATRLYIDGVQDGATYTGGYTISSGDSLYIGGGFYAPSTRTITGYIDEVRVTKGSDRGYTGSTITVPTAPFPDA